MLIADRYTQPAFITEANPSSVDDFNAFGIAVATAAADVKNALSTASIRPLKHAFCNARPYVM